MRSLSLIFLIIFGFLGHAIQLSCDITKALSSPKLAQNDKFWAEFSELSSSTKFSDDAVKQLLNKHGVDVDTAATSAASTPAAASTVAHTSTGVPRQAFTMTHKAFKDVEKLPANLRNKYDEFLGLIETGPGGMKNLTTQPGRWGLEKLAEGGFGPKAYSVRLNGGYRVAFRIDKDGKYEIFDVTKTTTHNN